MQEAQAETQKAKAAYQAELDAGQKWFDTNKKLRGEQKQQMMQAKTQIESLEAALSDERKRSRKKSKIVREMNLLA